MMLWASVPINHMLSKPFCLRRDFLRIVLLTLPILVAGSIAPAHLYLEQASYRVLHIAMEVFAVAISAMVFAIGWNAYNDKRPDNLLLLACMFFAVGAIDFAHLLSLAGMPDVVTSGSAAKAVNFWIAARILVAMALLTVAIRPWKPCASPNLRYGLLIASLTITVLVYWAGFYHADACSWIFGQHTGSVLPKSALQYGIVGLYLVAASLLLRQMQAHLPYNINYLFAAVVMMGLSELCFSFYTDADGISNLLGHVYKVFAYLFIYRGVFVDGVRDPYWQLLRSEKALATSEMKFRNLLEFAPDAILIVDREGLVTIMNAQAEKLFGYRRDEILGQPMEMLMPERFRDSYRKHRALYQQEPNVWEMRRGSVMYGRRKNGTEFPVDVSLSMLYTDDGGLMALIRDVTERRQQENARSQLIAILESTPDLVGSFSTSLNLLYLNRAGRRMLGLSADEDISARGISAFHPQWTVDIIHNAGLPYAAQHGVWMGDTAVLGSDGAEIPISQIIIGHKGEDGRVAYWSTIFRDISERKQHVESLLHQSTHDALTNLPNRVLFRDRLSQAIVQTEHSEMLIAVMFLDIDHFKNINDTFGHVFGDDLLKVLASRLRTVLRPEDTVARMGGDEFAILIQDMTNVQDVANIAEKLLVAVTEVFVVEGHHIFVSASIGITLFPFDNKDVDSLLRDADTAMYQAKAQGRNGFQFYTEDMNVRVKDRMELGNALRQALEQEEFVLYYQPRIELVTGTICGMEALIRWQHPEKGMLLPDKFIPVAEESGMIVAIGAWVLRTACRQVKVWQSTGWSHLGVAVNLSARQFAQQDLVQVVAAELQQSRLAPQYLELEITEGTVMEDTESAVKVLRQLKHLGVRLAIDDFGTGYSSLSYLKLFPLDYLKIDRSFVRDITTDPDDAMIAQSIIALAHSLDLRVIAEGVETEAQMKFLCSRHCDEMQGYHFSKPVASEVMTLMLQEGRSLVMSGNSLTESVRTLLIVDDEPNIIASLLRLLHGQKYRILTANNTTAAFEYLATNNVNVVLSDQRMPDMEGTEFLGKVKKLYPDTVRIMLTAYVDLESITAAINRGAIYKFVTKPWNDMMLLTILREAFELNEKSIKYNRHPRYVDESDPSLTRIHLELESFVK